MQPNGDTQVPKRKTAAVVFIHGLFSSSSVWDSLAGELARDAEIDEQFDFLFFPYSSAKFRLSPLRRTPDLNTLADKLKGFLVQPLARYERVVLVTHSQGGLIAQRYFFRMLSDGAGFKLEKIRGLVMFACPNHGSQLVLQLRKAIIPITRNRQERELRPISDSVIETQRRVLNGIVHAGFVSNHQCPVPVVAYAGEDDNIVTPVSAQSVFPESAVLAGDHSQIIQVTPTRLDAALHLKSQLLKFLVAAFPPGAQTQAAAVELAVPEDATSNMTSDLPLEVSVPGGQPISVTVHCGPIELISDVDIIATSENTYFEMSQSFKSSTSARLRRAAAQRSFTDGVLWDLASDGLISAMKKAGKFGLRWTPGDVISTASGALAAHGVVRIYHAAIVDPRPGTSEYQVDPEGITLAVRHIFERARRERAESHYDLTSVCFPLFGAGRGELDERASFFRIWNAIVQEHRRDPSWKIHFVSWKPSEADLIRSLLSEI